MERFCNFLDRAVEEANSVEWIHFRFFVIINIYTVLQFLWTFLAFGIFPETCPKFVSLVIHFWKLNAFCSYEIKIIFNYSKLSKIMELIYFPLFGFEKKILHKRFTICEVRFSYIFLLFDVALHPAWLTWQTWSY